MRVGTVLKVVLAMYWSWSIHGAPVRWSGEPTPLDHHRLILVTPDHTQTLNGRRLPPTPADGAAFGNVTALAGETVVRSFSVRHDGRYVIWIRAQYEPKNGPLDVRVTRRVASQSPLIQHQLRPGDGGPGAGGMAGYNAYREDASARTPGGGRATTIDTAFDADLELLELEQELDVEMDSSKRWIHLGRVDDATGSSPFIWWRIGAVDLTAGTFDLRLAGMNWQVDTGMLTTATDLVYPYVGDVNAEPASYIRFRIDHVPPDGVAISGRMQLHVQPWHSAIGYFYPAGLNDDADGKVHRNTGYTQWYRLQDIDNAPPFGDTETHMGLEISDGAKGASQLAVFPHGDFVLREFDWNEPSGRTWSMVTNFEAALHKLRTFRDHERENYERALRATGETLWPLTRGPLYLGNTWGFSRGAANDYMVKVLRLLGFNSVGCVEDTANHQRRYGWTGHGGEYMPPEHMPYNESETSAWYSNYYRQQFADKQEQFTNTSVYQCADEPVELYRAEMSSPLWRFFPAENGGPKWVDLPGQSILQTRRTDYRDCVLEGEIVALSNSVGFTVANGRFTVGSVSPNPDYNLAAGVDDATGYYERKAANIGKEPARFRIVYHDRSAELYLRDQLVHRLTGLTTEGRFAIVGRSKAITALSLRPLRKDEKTVDQPGAAMLDEPETVDDLDLDLDLELDETAELPAWAQPKPLKQFVSEDWQTAGGMPEAHAGFRQWAQAQGLEPTLFGKERWEQVSMITVPELVHDAYDRRCFYWSRRYSGHLTVTMLGLACDAIVNASGNPEMKAFVALSGHSLYMREQAQPLDMFALGAYGGACMPGISDWMSMGNWRWDSHQAVAFSVAPFNAGARVYGGQPRSFPMMHAISASQLRTYTMLANNCKFISYYAYGPNYVATEGAWSEYQDTYDTAQLTNNRVCQVDDIVSPAQARHSRVAMLYSMANEYWDPSPSFADKRATFLGLAHEYFQPELVTEEQVANGALDHYDALFVLDPIVHMDCHAPIRRWLENGGLLWTCADAFTKNQFNEGADFGASIAGLQRQYDETGRDRIAMAAASGADGIRSQSVVNSGIRVRWDGADIKAVYADGRPAWLEKAVGAGKMVYLAHRAGLSYTANALRISGLPVIWADTGREALVQPLLDARVRRELIVSESCYVATPMTSDGGTVILLNNMKGHVPETLTIRLRQPTLPHSVQTFDGVQLVEVSNDYQGGELVVTMPGFVGSQMIVVRDRPAPLDSRDAEMRTNVDALLASSDWADASAGAWFAGFRPAWKKGDVLVRLLTHAHRTVRRAAAEGLGRLRYSAGASPLVEQIGRETDDHALGDQLVALAKIGDDRTPQLALKHATHSRWFVRRQAARAIQHFLTDHDGAAADTATKDTAIAIHDQIRQDTDLRVSREAAPILGMVAPDQCLAMVLDDTSRLDHETRLQYLEQIAPHEREYGMLLARAATMSPADVLDVCQLRRTNSARQIMCEQVVNLATAEPQRFLNVAAEYRDHELAAKLFTVREQINASLDGERVAWILEHATGAGLGSNMDDWERYFANK